MIDEIRRLNELLTAEYRAITAYGMSAGLVLNAAPDDPLFPLAPMLVDVAEAFRSRHSEQAEVLLAAIEDLGGEPVDLQDAAERFMPPQSLIDHPRIGDVLAFAAMAVRAAP
jgi:hypothetical protein